jgi:hypothetical protein
MDSADGDGDTQNYAGTKRVREEDGEAVAKHRPASKLPGYKRPSNALVRLKISNKTELALRHLNRIDFCVFDLDKPVIIGRENTKNKADIELKGDKTISREHCRVTAVRGDQDCVVLNVAVFGKNGCIVDDQPIKSETGEVHAVCSGSHRLQLGSIHFDLTVSSKTLKKVKLPAETKDKVSSKDGSLARMRKESDKKSMEDEDKKRDRESNALSAVASEYLECRRNIGVVHALEEHCHDAATLFEEFKLFPMFPLPIHRRMLQIFTQVSSQPRALYSCVIS